MISYRLARQNIALSGSFTELDPRTPGTSAGPAWPEEIPPAQTLLSRAEGWVAGQDRLVEVWSAGAGWLVRVGGCRDLYVSPGGRAILPAAGGPELTAFEQEVALGPPVVLALALRGVWCFHASAIQHAGRVAAFSGVSGAGKSTLAAFINRQPAVQRVSDDILPIALEDGAVQALPHFPQLKLPPEEQPGLHLPEWLPLSALYLLDEQPELSISAYGQKEAALGLIRHTVAARLFDRELLARHLAFCGQASAVLPVRRLAYPRRFDALPDVWQAVKDDLAALPA
jgi:hypothetical protein